MLSCLLCLNLRTDAMHVVATDGTFLRHPAADWDIITPFDRLLYKKVSRITMFDDERTTSVMDVITKLASSQRGLKTVAESMASQCRLLWQNYEDWTAIMARKYPPPEIIGFCPERDQKDKERSVAWQDWECFKDNVEVLLHT
jgi:hypothetical protein